MKHTDGLRALPLLLGAVALASPGAALAQEAIEVPDVEVPTVVIETPSDQGGPVTDDSELDLANIVMVFLLAVVFVAVRYGRGPAVLAAFVSVAPVAVMRANTGSSVPAVHDCSHASRGAWRQTVMNERARPGHRSSE